ncbi:hypothetical protein SAMN06297387_11494 [Streptomyces zhaozhouensis]|uniref:Uncharacterized protein n=1 Tax=Streptomyces zhaozhouensis TaxID=1300267 RepID=A0A286DZT3_9ACTN|nr:hypothetical protein [Streptomyces zhaozhouensis]SOD64114.1 hypothetical protein SAMN06297387_11494 [Streptomyces zhaozhouensis]
MPTVQPPRRTGADERRLVEAFEAAEPEQDPADADAARAVCPDCSRSIALEAADAPLPSHALVATPWQPFGLTVCPGSGREPAATGWTLTWTRPARGDSLALATLPEGLDWRLQPFSHASGPAPALRQAA